jgi:ribosomal protein S18 acetylase RimI-like enzyme
MHTLHWLTAADVSQAAAFVARLQTDPAHHIAYIGTASEDEIAAAFSGLEPGGLANVLTAQTDGRIIGLLGADVSAKLRRAWWYGPLVEHDDWDAVANDLYQSASATLPLASIREEELFVDEANLRAAAFGQRHGFAAGEAEIGLWMGHEKLATLPALEAPTLPYAWRGAFAFLHDRLFPKTEFSATEILKRIGPHDRVFAVIEAGIFLGYAYAQAEPELGIGSLHVVGVAEPARRRGIGYQLTIAALRWLFSFAAMDAITVTVGAHNTPALELFAQLGFEHEQTLLPFRKPRLPGSPVSRTG